MSRRIKLRCALAFAIAVTLNGMVLSLPNTRRYVTRELLTAFRICRDTPLCGSDWVVALHIARAERASRNRDGIPYGRAPAKTRIDKIASSLILPMYSTGEAPWSSTH